jgi:hypothetical protein
VDFFLSIRGQDVADNSSKKGVVEVHTPDASEYHQDLTAYGTTIPSSTTEGGSKGFDPNKPGRVIIDPDLEDGNKVIDYSKFSKYKQKFNVSVGQAGGSDPDSAFEALTKAAAEIEAVESAAMAAPVSSGTRKKENTVMSTSNKITLSPEPVHDRTEVAPVRRQAVREEPVGSDVARQLASQTEVLSQLAGALTALQAPAHDPEPLPEDKPQTISQVKQEIIDEKIRDKVISGFETLEMEFINGPLPTKPKKEVYFEMPNMGTMAARYHDVQDGGTCLALIYDTRYEDGYQFMPPALGDTKITMTVPRENKTYSCSSVGIHFSVGVLDIVVLFKHSQENDTEEL